jgi:molecular chaperone GrpE
LTPEGIEIVLADFRAWLTDLAAGTVSEPEPQLDEPLDLHALFGQFTALRHEVNLQTRAVRAQQEQNAETLQRLREAVEVVHQAAADETDDDGPTRTMLKSLVEVADALALAKQEVERLAQTADSSLHPIRALADQRSVWARWFAEGRSAGQQAGAAAGRVQQLLDSVLAGYRMSLQRLERVLQQHGLDPIPCAGLAFNPERMEAIEAVADSGRPIGEVLAVVRPGYEWNGKPFRHALVRVAK